MSEVQPPAGDAESPFAELREKIEHGLRDENEKKRKRRLAELEAILGPRCPEDGFDDIRYFDSDDEVRSHASLAEDAPARKRAAKILEELLASPELRQALLPRLLRDGPSPISDWVFIWQDLEEEHRRLLFAETIDREPEDARASQGEVLTELDQALCVARAKAEEAPNDDRSGGSRQSPVMCVARTSRSKMSTGGSSQP